MKFYNDKEPIYLEIDLLEVGLGGGLLLWPIAFATKSLFSAKTHYSNIEREALGIVHGLQKFQHYHFAREVNDIADHK